MHVPFFKPTIDDTDKKNINQVIDSGWLTTGKWCKEFEKKFEEFIGVRNCVAVNSATAALHLSVVASKIRSDEYVLVPTMTFAATAEILYYLGIHPILVDCNMTDLCISLEDAKKKILQANRNGKKVTGIIPVHYAGKMCDMDLVDDFADEFDLEIIEDAAHCCGSKYFSKKNKQWLAKSPKSLTQCYSFYCNKCITTCGEGGMVVSDSSEISEKIRSLSLHGLSTSAWERFGKKGSIFYDIAQVGYKYNLTDVAAAMGCAQLDKENHLKTKRTEAVRLYKQLLKSNPYVTFLSDDEENFIHSYHLFVIRYKQQSPSSITRDQLLQSLKDNDIVTSVHWKPLHLHTFYKKQGLQDCDLPNATQLFSEIVSLPLFADITKDQIVYVVNTLNRLLNA